MGAEEAWGLPKTYVGWPAGQGGRATMAFLRVYAPNEPLGQTALDPHQASSLRCGQGSGQRRPVMMITT